MLLFNFHCFILAQLIPSSFQACSSQMPASAPWGTGLTWVAPTQIITWIIAWEMVDGHEKNSPSKEQGGRWVGEAAGAPSLGFPANRLDKISSRGHRVRPGLLSPPSCTVSCLWAFWHGPVLQGWQLFIGDFSCCGHRLKQYCKPISSQTSFYTCSLLSTSHTLWSCNSSLVLQSS